MFNSSGVCSFHPLHSFFSSNEMYFSVNDHRTNFHYLSKSLCHEPWLVTEHRERENEMGKVTMSSQKKRGWRETRRERVGCPFRRISLHGQYAKTKVEKVTRALSVYALFVNENLIASVATRHFWLLTDVQAWCSVFLFITSSFRPKFSLFWWIRIPGEKMKERKFSFISGSN